jgi:hypothetical protein
MRKNSIKKQKEPSYLERPILEVLGKIKNAHYNKINKQFSEKINNYLNDVYATKSGPGIVLAEKKLEQILEQIPESVKIEKTALDRILSVQEKIGKKPTIKDLSHYTKLRDKISYKELKKDYRGEKQNSLKGFEGQYQRRLKKDKEALVKTGRELVKAGEKLVDTLGRKLPTLENYSQYKALRNKGWDNDKIKRRRILKSNYILRGFGKRYAAESKKKKAKKRTKKRVKRIGRKPFVKSSEDYIGLIESGETYESVKENYGNDVLQLRAWQANYTRHHK